MFKNIFRRIIISFCKKGRYQTLRIALFAIILSLITGSVLLLLLQKNPFLAYKSLLQGSGILSKAKYPGRSNQFTDFLNLLNYSTPMIFAALSVTIALKCGLFNICVSGTMVFSGFISTILFGYTNLNPILAKSLVVITGLISGMLIGALVGYLKYKFNMNEVLVAIMLNYIISYIVSFFIQAKIVDPVTRQSIQINQNARLTLMDVRAFNLKMNISLLFFLAIISIFLIKFILDKTKLGFELKAVGSNEEAAKYAGMNVGKTILTTMIISGSLAGLAGVSFYLGSYGSIQPRVLPSLGYDAIAVALLGNINPIGALPASFLIMIFETGTAYLSSRLNVLREIASLITSILLLFTASSIYFKNLAKRFERGMK